MSDMTIKVEVNLKNHFDLEEPTALLDNPDVFYSGKFDLKKGDRVTFEFLNVPSGFRPLVFPLRSPRTTAAKPTHPLGRADSLVPIGDTIIQAVVSDRTANGYEYWLWLIPVVPGRDAIHLRCNDGPGETVGIGAMTEDPKPPG